MLKKLIIFLVRRRFSLCKYEGFQFTNQSPKNNDIYYFTSDELLKEENGVIRPSGVSLNWLLNTECAIRRVDR